MNVYLNGNIMIMVHYMLAECAKIEKSEEKQIKPALIDKVSFEGMSKVDNIVHKMFV